MPQNNLLKTRRAVTAGIRTFRTEFGRFAEPACIAINKAGLTFGIGGCGNWHLRLVRDEKKYVSSSDGKTPLPPSTVYTNLALTVNELFGINKKGTLCREFDFRSKLNADTSGEAVYSHAVSQWDSRQMSITFSNLHNWLVRTAEALEESLQKKPRDRELARGFLAMQKIAAGYGPLERRIQKYQEAFSIDKKNAAAAKEIRVQKRRNTAYRTTLNRARKDLDI